MREVARRGCYIVVSLSIYLAGMKPNLHRNSNHRHVGNRGVFEEQSFQLRGGDLVALDFDQFLSLVRLALDSEGVWDHGYTFIRSTTWNRPPSST